MKGVSTISGSWAWPWLRQTLPEGIIIEVWKPTANNERLWLYYDTKPEKSHIRLPAWMTLV